MNHALTPLPGMSPNPRQVDEFPGARQGTDRHLNERWAVTARESAFECTAELLRVACPFSGSAETLSKSHKIRVGEVAGNDPVAEPFFLDAPHIAVGTV